MDDLTKIEWAWYTFNPWIGCQYATVDGDFHPGCLNCYAKADMDDRRGRARWGPNGTRSLTSEANWHKPVLWNQWADFDSHVFPKVCKPEFSVSMCDADLKSIARMKAAGLIKENTDGSYEATRPWERPRVFCGSLMDVFEEWKGPMVLPEYEGGKHVRNKVAMMCPSCYVFKTCNRCSKCGRDTVTASMYAARERLFPLIASTDKLLWMLLTKRPGNVLGMWRGAHLDNAIVGTSVSDQGTADELIPKLRDVIWTRVCCGGGFLSIEPLLAESLDLKLDKDDAHWLKWVIVGGESGRKARNCPAPAITSIIKQCRSVGIPVFVKQLGTRPVQLDYLTGRTLRIKHKKGGDLDEWPHGLRVRETIR